ncbi:MAG: flagellar hook-basal body complex protein FliE [Verrucomicrobiia bacterium]|jgi:flagellar hook-basal body complex protein FliE
MTPLSSINAYVSPNGLIQFLPQANQTKSLIPAAELPTVAETTPATTATPAASSFTDVLGKAVQEVNSKQSAASDAINGLLSGQNVSLHQAMISMQEANVSFQLMVEVRNKLLDSYQELMRMQV